MFGLVRYLEPSSIGLWLARTFLLYLLTYATVWSVALLIARLGSHEKQDPIMQVYVGWIIPTALHLLLWTTVLLQSMDRFYQVGLSRSYCILYLLPIALDTVMIFQFVIVMRHRRGSKSIEGDD